MASDHTKDSIHNPAKWRGLLLDFALMEVRDECTEKIFKIIIMNPLLTDSLQS
jgi:hypothetical protein